MNSEVLLFKDNDGKDVSFEDLLKTIYENSIEKRNSIIEIAKTIAPKIDSLADAMAILPHLTDLQNTAIKNDEQLIKLAVIAQRGISKPKSKFDSPIEDFGFTPEQRREMLERAKKTMVPGSSSD